jgi:hypothetical protein
MSSFVMWSLRVSSPPRLSTALYARSIERSTPQQKPNSFAR